MIVKRLAILGVGTCLFLWAGESNQLVGRWSTGRISSIQYRDAYTGVSRPTNGNHFAYEFLPDGTYSFTGLMQNTVYNCTTSMFSNETGKYTMKGNVVSLEPEKNPYRIRYSCAPASNREAPGKLVPRSFEWSVEGEDLHLKAASDGAVSTMRRSRD